MLASLSAGNLRLSNTEAIATYHRDRYAQARGAGGGAGSDGNADGDKHGRQRAGRAAPLRKVEGKPIAKRGHIPGITENPRLKRLI
jgi:hypothetical protein